MKRWWFFAHYSLYPFKDLYTSPLDPNRMMVYCPSILRNMSLRDHFRTRYNVLNPVSFLISRSSNCPDRMERMIMSQRLRSFCDSAKIALRNWSILYTFSLWMTLLFSWAHASTSAVSNSSKERPCGKYISDPYFVSTAMLRSHNR